MKKLSVLVLAVTCAFVLTVNPVSAFAETRTGDVTERGYTYEFGDDPMSAGAMGPNEGVLKLRKRAARVTLIRPRCHFVAELLKSVENL